MLTSTQQEELGLGRVQDLPMEDGGRNGRGRMASGPIVTVNRPAPQGAWYIAIAGGEFDDDDAEAVKGLDNIADGRLHAIRDQDHDNGGGQYLAAGRAHYHIRRSSPFPPKHNIQQPVPGFDFGPVLSLAPAMGKPQLQVAKGKQTSQKQPAINMPSKKRQGQQHDIATHVDKKRRAASAASSGQSMPSSRHPIATSYRLPSRPPPGLLSPASNQTVDISQRLPGVEILYRCMAQLLEPGSKPATGALVTWCRPPQAGEPMLLVLVGMDIRHQYPATRWKSQRNGGPDTVFIKLKEDSAAEVTVGLIFAAQPAADAFLLFSRKLIDGVKSQSKAISQSPEPATGGSPAASAPLPKIQITPPSSDTSAATGASTAAKRNINGARVLKSMETSPAINADWSSRPRPKAVTNRAVNGVIKTSQSSQDLQPQKKLVANIVGTAQGSQTASATLLNWQFVVANQTTKPKAEASEVKAPVEEASHLISVDSVSVPVTTKARGKTPSYMNDLCSLSTLAQNAAEIGQQPGSNAFLDSQLPQLAVASPGAAENAAVAQLGPPQGSNSHGMATSASGATAGEVFSRCKTIISQTSDILRLGPMDGISVDEGIRRRLLGEIAEKFKGINKGQKGHAVSMLLRLFDTVIRPDGLRYSAEELEKLRSDAVLPSGWVCHNVRADLLSRVSSLDDEETVQDIADIRKQLDRVAGKQAELAQAQAQAEAQADAKAKTEAKTEAQADVKADADAHSRTQDGPAPVKGLENSRWASIALEGSALRDLVELVSGTNQASVATRANSAGTPAVLSPQERTSDPMDALDSVFKALSLGAAPSARSATPKASSNVFRNTNVPANNSGIRVFQGAKLI
ncbi:hypothetical protein RB595_002940 [Gaeumannomyces hyphopodioides]